MKNILFLVILFCFVSCKGSAYSEDFAWEVKSNGINIRSDSTVNAPVICAVNKGERLVVLTELYDWYKIRLPAQAPSFVKKEFVVSEGGAPCISKDSVNIRLEPNETSPIIGKADKGERITVKGEHKDWLSISPPSGSFGWIHKRFVEKAAAVAAPVPVQPPVIEPQPAAPQPAVAAPQDKSVTVEGVIRSYSGFFKREFTHNLLTADNKTFLLKGDEDNLETLTRRKVRVKGTPINTPGQKYPLLEVISITPLD